jgi:hypothetical protein
MRIPDERLKRVVFIGIEVQSATTQTIKWCGTGFFISYRSSKIKSKDMSFFYLVTARHIVAEVAGKIFYIRANTKDGKSTIFKGNDEVEWWFHPKEDESSDVAVIQLFFKDDFVRTLDYAAIPIEDCLTDDIRRTENIGVGDEVFITGLFALHSGNEKNLPIIRTGNIAMIPDE